MCDGIRLLDGAYELMLLLLPPPALVVLRRFEFLYDIVVFSLSSLLCFDVYSFVSGLVRGECGGCEFVLGHRHSS